MIIFMMHFLILQSNTFNINIFTDNRFKRIRYVVFNCHYSDINIGSNNYDTAIGKQKKKSIGKQNTRSRWFGFYWYATIISSRTRKTYLKWIKILPKVSH